MKLIIVSISTFALISQLQAQNVGIGTTSPNASAALHGASTTRGFLPPRMTSTQRNAIAHSIRVRATLRSPKPVQEFTSLPPTTSVPAP